MIINRLGELQGILEEGMSFSRRACPAEQAPRLNVYFLSSIFWCDAR
jgi:hypothetical protein